MAIEDLIYASDDSIKRLVIWLFFVITSSKPSGYFFRTISNILNKSLNDEDLSQNPNVNF